MSNDTIAQTIAAVFRVRAEIAAARRGVADAPYFRHDDLLALCDAAEAGLRCPPREPTQEMDAAVGNDADARDAVAPSPPVPPSPDGVQSSISPLCVGRYVVLALSRANVVIVRLTRERYEARVECERLRAELLHLVQAYSNRHSPQHRAAALNSAQGLLAAIDAGRRGE